MTFPKRSPNGDLGDNLGEVTIGTQAESRTSRRTNHSIVTRDNISVTVDDGRDYVKCRTEVDGKAIWRLESAFVLNAFDD